jgi:hypothetical protein
MEESSMTQNALVMQRRLRVAGYAGLVWAAFQAAMMLYSRNLTIGSSALNVVPVLLLSVGLLRANIWAALALAVYGTLRLWMAFPVLVRLFFESAPLPKHWWIALVAIPFALLWILAGYHRVSARLIRRQ